MGFRLRSLMNVRAPMAADETFLAVQDDYLRRELDARGVVRLSDLRPLCGDLYLWQGDITRLQCGAIVNAANAGMTGCYIPCHACIDNCIHTYAGVQLRRDCAEIMAAQGSAEPTGRAKITRAYNLPCDYVLHTVGPIVNGRVTSEDERLLAACYRSCLELAAQHGVQSVAFCCISTGVFHFPNERAAEIAVETVRRYKSETESKVKVIFNVFKDADREIYERLLGADWPPARGARRCRCRGYRRGRGALLVSYTHLKIEPDVGCSSRFRHRINVDLPEPDGPMTAATSPL